MGNCLVTQLKSAVDNSGLKKLGVFEIKHYGYAPNTLMVFNIDANKPISLKIVSGDALFDEDISHVTYSADRKEVFLQANYSYSNSVRATSGSKGGDIFIDVSDKYAVTRFGNYMGNNDTEDFEFMENLTELACVPGRDIHGDISFLRRLTNLKDLCLNSVGSVIDTTLTGDISSFSALKNLETIQCLRCAGLTGNLNALLDNLHAAGKRGSLSVNFRYCTNIQYTGTTDIHSLIVSFTFDNSGWRESQ